MNTRRTLRLLTPLLAAFVVACNINESTGVSSKIYGPEQGVFAPRVVAASGRLAVTDSVYLTLWTRKDASAKWDTVAYFKKLWADSGVRVDTLKVGTLWMASIAGVTKGDTLWKGWDSGSIAAVTTRDLQDSTNRLRVKALQIRPDTVGFTNRVALGDALTLPQSWGKVAHAWGISLPDCEKDTAKVFPVIGSVLNLQTCGDSLTWSSAVISHHFTLLPSVSGTSKFAVSDVSALLASTPDAQALSKRWDSAVIIPHPVATTMSWSLSLAACAKATDGNGDSLQVPKDWLASLPATGTSFPATAIVRLKDNSGNLVDSIRIRWFVTVPVTPTPTLSHSFSKQFDTLITSWSPCDSSSLRLDGLTNTPMIMHFGRSDTFQHSPVKSGASILTRLVAYSAITGRRSDTALDSAIIPNPPQAPKFTAKNVDSLTGMVLIRIDTTGQSGTRWIYGWSDTGVASMIQYSDTLHTDSSRFELNTGKWLIGMRALRDGLSRDSVIPVQVQRSKGTKVGRPGNLRLVGRTENSLTWTWDKVVGRGYRLFLQKGSYIVADSLANDPAPLTPAPKVDSTTTASYTATGLQYGETWTLAVVALKGADSSGGNSIPAQSSGTVRNPPPIPATTITLNDSIGGLKVRVSNSDSGTGSVLISSNGYLWSQKNLKNGSWDTLGLQGNYKIAACLIRDSIQKCSDTQTIAITKTNALVPNPVTRLTLVSRTASSLIWTWDTLPRHVYTVHYGVGNTVPTDITTGTLFSKAPGRFEYSALASNTSIWMAVTATSLDSTGGSSPATSLVGTTRNPPPPATNVLVGHADGSVTVSYTKVNGVEYTIRCIGAGTTINQVSTRAIDTVSLPEGTYTIKVVTSRDSLWDSSAVTSNFVVIKPSSYTRAKPTGFAVTANTKSGVGDTSFSLTWDARTNAIFELSVTPKTGGSATVYDTNATRMTIPVTPGQGYYLSLRILANADTGNSSPYWTIDTMARMAPTAPSISAMTWDGNSQAMLVALSAIDTTVASYSITDSNGTLGSTRTIPNVWTSNGNLPLLSLASLNTTNNQGNLTIHLRTVGKNGLISSESTASQHIPQRISMTTNKPLSWAVGPTIKLRQLDTLFLSTPSRLTVRYAATGKTSTYQNTDTTFDYSNFLKFDVAIGNVRNVVALSFQGRWANGDTTEFTNPAINKDSVVVTMNGAVGGSYSAALDSFTIWEKNAFQKIRLSGNVPVGAIYWLHWKTANAWVPLTVSSGGSFAGTNWDTDFDSIGVQPYARKYGPIGLYDSAERLAVDAIPDTLIDARDGDSYPVKAVNGKAWMTQNLRVKPAQRDPDVAESFSTCYLNNEAFCDPTGTSPLNGRLYTLSQALGLKASNGFYNYDCDTLPWTGLASGSAGCKDANLQKSAAGTLQGICPAGWHLPSVHEWDTILTLGYSKLTEAESWNGNPNLTSKITVDSSSMLSVLFTRYGYRSGDDPSFQSTTYYTFAPLSDVRTMYWSVPGTTSYGANTTSGAVFQPQSKSMPYSSNNVWYYIPGGSTAGIAYKRRIIYPIRCVKN